MLQSHVSTVAQSGQNTGSSEGFLCEGEMMGFYTLDL